MLYLVGINHETQNDQEGNKDRAAYLQSLKKICEEKSVQIIFEEWPPGTFFPSLTLMVTRELGVSYIQIDLSEDERLYPNYKYKKSPDKKREAHDHRERKWVERIKSNHKDSGDCLLIVGMGHIKNDFPCSNQEDDRNRFSLECSLLDKLRDEGIDSEILSFALDPHASN